jgi:hypothetical protein
MPSFRDGHPSILRTLICPEASNAGNNMAAVSADGSTDARHKTSISQLTSPPEAIPFMFPENTPHLIPTQCRTAPLYCDRRSDASRTGDGGVIADAASMPHFAPDRVR